MASSKNKLTAKQADELLQTVKSRFEKHKDRHKGISWDKVEEKLRAKPSRLASLFEMEETGGEPDVVGIDKKSGEFLIYDCAPESPKGRRSLCYDHDALASRKEHKPKYSALQMAKDMGIEMLDEEQYRYLQQFGNFDTKTSSWLVTPSNIRKLGGAIFGDYRYGTVFFYHNGAESYYGSRGFRGCLRV